MLGTINLVGKQARDEGMKTALKNSGKWAEQAFASACDYIDNYSANSFTGEEIRFHVTKKVGKPNHPNAWGGLINTLLKRMMIIPNGYYRHMTDITSHARKTPVYTKA